MAIKPIVSIVLIVTVAASASLAKAPARPKARPEIHAAIRADAKKWQPVSLLIGGDHRKIRTAISFRTMIEETKVKTSPAEATVKLHGGPNSSWLVYSIWPKAFELKRKHVEVRLRLMESYVEEARTYVVTVTDRRTGAGAGFDSNELRRRGIEFEEVSGESGRIEIAAIDHRPSKSAKNSGRLRAVGFADRDLSHVDLSWSIVGLAPIASRR